MKEKLHKYSFLGCLLLAGIVFFTWTDNWQVYTEPLQETYTKGVLLVEQLVEGKWPGISGEQSDATGSVSGNVPGENVQTGDTVSDGNQTDQTMGTVQSPVTGEEAAMPETTGTETQDPAATVPVEEIPQEVVYHTVDDSYFDDAVFIGDSRTVGMYEYGGLEETSTFYASTGLTVYKMFDSAIVSVPGQKKKITVEEALSEKQFAKIYLMIGINEMGTGTHFVDTDHQIDLGKLLLRQGFLHRDLFLLSRHRYNGTVEHLVDCQSGGSIKRGRLLQSAVLIHAYRPGIPDKYRIIKITVIHRVIDHFLRYLFHRNRRGGILRLCSGGLRHCGLFSRNGTLHRTHRLIRLVPVTHCISGLYVFPRHIAGYGSRCITLFPGYSRPFSFHQLLHQKHSFRIGLLQRFRIYLPVIRPGKEYNSRQQKTSQKGVFMQFFLHFRPNIFIFCMIHCIMTFS